MSNVKCVMGPANGMWHDIQHYKAVDITITEVSATGSKSGEAKQTYTLRHVAFPNGRMLRFLAPHDISDFTAIEFMFEKYGGK